MEYVKGKELFHHVSDKGYLKETEASIILEQILLLLEYLKNTGVVHRDIRPENIIIIPESYDQQMAKSIKVIDFGIAKYFIDLKANTEIVGSLNYIAPEVLNDTQYDYASDMFSLGVTFYFMVTGDLPFHDDVMEFLIHNIVSKEFNPLTNKKIKDLSPECLELLGKMLEKDPKIRITPREALIDPFIKNRNNLEKSRRKKNGDVFDFNKLGDFKYVPG